jgi:hypothetical protein
MIFGKLIKKNVYFFDALDIIYSIEMIIGLSDMKTLTFFGKKFTPKKWFWFWFLCMFLFLCVMFFFACLGVKKTIAFDSWILAIIMSLFMFVELETQEGKIKKKHSLFSQNLRYVIFISFFLIGVLF